MAEFATHAEQLAGNGYDPVPVAPGTKKVLIEGWTTTYRFEAAHARRYTREACGLRTARMPVADIDVRREALAQRLQALAEERLGHAPVRIGAAPKRALIYRSMEPFKKLATRAFRFKDDATTEKAHKVEFLGDGQHVVAYGTHPDTRKPYEWINGSNPLNTLHSELPEITAAQAADFLRAHPA